jgi:hypothetical protein
MKGKIIKIKRFTGKKKSKKSKDSQAIKNHNNKKIHKGREINLFKRFV